MVSWSEIILDMKWNRKAIDKDKQDLHKSCMVYHKD